MSSDQLQGEYLESITINGVEVKGLKIIPFSKAKGFCRYHLAWFDAGTRIAYKHRDRLTDVQRAAIFGDEVVYDLLVRLPLREDDAKAAWAGRVGGMRKAKKWDWEMSEYQTVIWDAVRTRTKHIFVEALAGCAKTSTAIRVCKELAKLGATRGKRCFYLAFNKSIEVEIRPDLNGTGVSGNTTHGFMLREVLMKCYPNLRDPDQFINNYRDTDLFWQILCLEANVPNTGYGRKELRANSHKPKMMDGVAELVDLIKSWAILPKIAGGRWRFDDDQFQRVLELIEEYRIVIEEGSDENDYAEYAMKVAVKGLPLPGQPVTEITFGDMLWLPLVLELPLPALHLVVTDESQDFNACQIMILWMLANKGCRSIVIGDEFQAVYRFRGADCRAFANILEMLQRTQRGVEVLELPINYRCGQSIIRHANQWVPNLQGASKEEGVVQENLDFERSILEAIQPTDRTFAFLCRTGAPLMVAAYYTLTKMIQTLPQGEHKQVCIIGKASGGGPLKSLIKELCRGDDETPATDRINDLVRDGEVVETGLLSRLAVYRQAQIVRLGGETKYAMKLEEILGNAKCVEVIATAVKGDRVAEIVKQIESMFVERITSDPSRVIVFSTVHRAKGLEWDTVRVIRPDLLPHPLAKANADGSWSDEQQQEENLCFIAATRPRLDMGYITNWPFQENGKAEGLQSLPVPKAHGSVTPLESDPLVRHVELPAAWVEPSIKPAGPTRRAIEVQEVAARKIHAPEEYPVDDEVPGIGEIKTEPVVQPVPTTVAPTPFVDDGRPF